MTLRQSRLDPPPSCFCEKAIMAARGMGAPDYRDCRGNAAREKGESLALTVFENVNVESISLYSGRVSELCRASYERQLRRL